MKKEGRNRNTHSGDKNMAVEFKDDSEIVSNYNLISNV
jgi:hypothetical protein